MEITQIEPLGQTQVKELGAIEFLQRFAVKSTLQKPRVGRAEVSVRSLLLENQCAVRWINRKAYVVHPKTRRYRSDLAAMLRKRSHEFEADLLVNEIGEALIEVA